MGAKKKPVKPIICAISSDKIDDIWHLAEPHIVIGVEASRGELTVDGVRQALVDGDMILLLVYSDKLVVSALVLSIVVHMSGKRTIGVSVCGGTDLDDWMDGIVDAIDAIGAEFNCDEAVIIGRHGWQRKLADHGYRKSYTAISREIR